jgi:hypothetical protein
METRSPTILRADTEAKETNITDEENEAFCSKFGIGPGTAHYAQCASELTQIRARHLERYISEYVLPGDVAVPRRKFMRKLSMRLAFAGFGIVFSTLSTTSQSQGPQAPALRRHRHNRTVSGEMCPRSSAHTGEAIMQAVKAMTSALLGRAAVRESIVGICASVLALMVGAVPAFAQTAELGVKIERVTALDRGDAVPPSAADFYAKITIDGFTYQTPTVWGQDNIRPGWEYSQFVPFRGGHPITIEVRDSDGLFGSQSVDINPLPGNRTLNMKVFLGRNGMGSCLIVGGSGVPIVARCNSSIVLSGGERRRARLTFRIISRIVDNGKVSALKQQK